MYQQEDRAQVFCSNHEGNKHSITRIYQHREIEVKHFFLFLWLDWVKLWPFSQQQNGVKFQNIRVVRNELCFTSIAFHNMLVCYLLTSIQGRFRFYGFVLVTMDKTKEF